MNNSKFSILYKIYMSIKTVGENSNNFMVSPSDIISIAFIHNYDNASFPIIRIRLYSDLRVMEKLMRYPDQIYVSLSMNGNVYKMNEHEENKSPTLVSGATNINFSLKGYIENKNTPTSIMDSYDQGVKKESDLNVDRKVPIELFCYDDNMIHFTRQEPSSIFKNMSIESVIKSIFRNQGLVNLYIDPVTNQKKYNQILIPNLNINKTISFFDSRYGLYPKGAHMYGDIDKMYICNSDVNNGFKPLPIYVESYKSSSDMGGVRKINNTYQMNIKDSNVSVISETDIERVLNSENINSINLNTLELKTITMNSLYSDIDKERSLRITSDKNIKNICNKIKTPDILYKSDNDYLSETYNARITERVTRMDISGVGFDIGKIKINSRFNVIFDSPIRGISINKIYRPTYVNHVISNLDSDLFIAQTTMNLCNN